MLCDRGAQSEQEQKGKTESAIDKWWAQYPEAFQRAQTVPLNSPNVQTSPRKDKKDGTVGAVRGSLRVLLRRKARAVLPSLDAI